MARVLIVGSLAESLINFRGDLIRHLIARGHEVVALAPGISPDVDRRLGSWGVRRLQIGLDRTGVSLVADFRLLFELRRTMRTERIDVMLAYTIKPVVYGTIAARLAGIPRRAAMITGLGFAFAHSTTLRQHIVRVVARLLYRVAMACSNTVFFQNPDDEADFRRNGLLGASQLTVQIGGSGINLGRFAVVPMPEGPIRFLMIARLLVDKGVREFIQAATLVHRLFPQVKFDLVGPFDDHPSSVSRDEVSLATISGAITYHGAVTDVRPILASCHIYVLPSYREGTPRSVLEAMAVGRPVITTDAPGCRETVIPGENGLLVAPRQVESLVKAILDVTAMPRERLLAMARRSRELVEERFDVNVVNSHISLALGL